MNTSSNGTPAQSPDAVGSPNAAQQFQAAFSAYTEDRYTDALAMLDGLPDAQPFAAGSRHLRGLIAFALKQNEDALHWVRAALAIEPCAEMFNTLCVVQSAGRDYEGAIDSARQGLALRPDLAVLHYNMGLALQLLGRFDEAAPCYRSAIERAPEHTAAHNNLGILLKTSGQLDQAEYHFRHAISANPSNLEARSNLGHVLMKKGLLTEAWPYFEDRWACYNGVDGSNSPHDPRSLPIPQWTGAHDIEGAGRRHLLVFHEQGFGDSLQFARYLPLVHERFEKVGFVCPRPLHRLFEDSFGSRLPRLELLDSMPDSLDGWDWHSPLLSLPMAFGTRLDTIPAAVPYLHADEARATHWRERLDAAANRSAVPRVGLVWAGDPRPDQPGANRVDGRRSLRASAYLPLLRVPGFAFVNLQKGDLTRPQIDELPAELRPFDPMDDVRDFADTAAIIECLDLVITVDTSVAHLAGALGKPVWILSRYDGCWRWLEHRDDSPWYPTARLFRQPQPGDWDDVIVRVTQALQLRGEAGTSRSR